MSSAFGSALAEPVVGEVTALRSFRVTDDGYFIPLSEVGGTEPWPTETAAAICARGRKHASPDPMCTCGFYAYGDREWVESAGIYAWSELVLAAVHCSGRIVAGEKGVRAERMRLVGCYVTPGIPHDVLALLKEHYPEVEFFTSKKALLGAFPETRLSTYFPKPRKRISLRSLWDAVMVICGIAVFANVALVATFLHDSMNLLTITASVFVLYIWAPMLYDVYARRKVGLTPPKLRWMKHATDAPWKISTFFSSFGTWSRLHFFVLASGMSTMLLSHFVTEEALAAPLAGWVIFLCVLGAVALYFDGRRGFPVSKLFPLVSRTGVLRDFRKEVGDDVYGRWGKGLQEKGDDYCAMMLDMGGYGIGVVHFLVASDPEDHSAARNSKKKIDRMLSRMARTLNLGDRWVGFIASEDALVRAFSRKRQVSVPFPLTEANDIIPFPAYAWYPPELRANYYSTVEGPAVIYPPQSAPTQQAGYFAQRPPLTAFSNPTIRAGLEVARTANEKFGYREYKKIEANLPDSLRPAAVPPLPSLPAGTSLREHDAALAVAAGFFELAKVETTPSTVRPLIFALVEMMAALGRPFDVDSSRIFTLHEPSEVQGMTGLMRGAVEGQKVAHWLMEDMLGIDPDEVDSYTSRHDLHAGSWYFARTVEGTYGIFLPRGGLEERFDGDVGTQEDGSE